MELRAPAIETAGLSIGYALKGGKKKVLHPSLELALLPGEVTSLLGLNGAGKSTLLRTLAGFLPPLGGNIRVLGKPVSAYTTRQLSLTVGVVLTEKTNAGGITAYELVSLGRHPYTGFFGRLQENDHRIVRASLEAAGIGRKARQYVSELSDGERQKVFIAKALAQECPVILLDEPTAFLDVTSRLETMTLLRKLAAEQQKTILLSTHDLDLAVQMSDRLWLLSRTHPFVSGTPEELILSGRFGSFFEKENIRFDISTGKLQQETTAIAVHLEGEMPAVYWVANALRRNGFLPATTGTGALRIRCVSGNRFEIESTPEKRELVSGIEGLIDRLRRFRASQA